MRRLIGVLAIMVGLGATTARGEMLTVNVDLGDLGYNCFAELGAAQDTGTTWTESDESTTLSNLVDSFGNPTTIGLTVNSGWTGSSESITTNYLEDRLYMFGTGLSPTFGFTGLNSNTIYDIYLYTFAVTTEFTLSGTSTTKKALANSSGAGSPPSWVEDDHYVVFRNLTGANQYLFTARAPSVEADRVGWVSGTYAAATGMQLQVVPEPTAILLLAAGLVALVPCRRRRKR